MKIGLDSKEALEIYGKQFTYFSRSHYAYERGTIELCDPISEGN